MSTFTIDSLKTINTNSIKIKFNQEFSIPNSSLIGQAIKSINEFSNNTALFSGGIFVKNHARNSYGIVKASNAPPTIIDTKYSLFSLLYGSYRPYFNQFYS